MTLQGVWSSDVFFSDLRQRDHRDGMGLDVEAFRQTYTEQSDPDLVQRIRDRFDTTPSCRHDSMVIALGWACREATYGKINAGDMFDLQIGRASCRGRRARCTSG